MAILKEEKNISLVLLDLHMPGMKEIEFLKKARGMSEFDNIPFLVVSTYDDPKSKCKAFKAGASIHSFYPIDKKAMQKTVSEYLLLGESRAKAVYFENIYNSLSCGVVQYRLKPNFTLININKKALELLNCNGKESFEKKKNDVKDKYDQTPKSIKEREKNLKFGSSFSYDFQVIIEGEPTKLIHCTKEIVLDFFGEPLHQNILTDITQEKLTLSEVRNKLLLGQIDTITFQWDCEKKIGEFFNNAEDKYGIKSKYDNFPEEFINSDIICEKDRESLLDAFEKIENENEDYNQEFRIVAPSGEIIWCEIMPIFLKDELGKVKIILGILRNIDCYKRRIEKAQFVARRDSLTGLYNRKYFETNSTEDICDVKNGSMFIIDVDNFKKVNDSRGHLVGDEVLKSISHILTSVFRDKDVVARTGGDEFAVLLKGKIDLKIIQKKVDEIINFVLELSKRNYHENEISVSIGICIFDDLSVKGNETEIFNVLYEKADEAMYKSKYNGKSTYSIVEL